MRGLITLVIVGATFLSVGCSARRVTDFTLISTKNTLLVAHAESQGERIEGEDCSITLFGVPNMKTAIDDALDNASDDYDALVDGVVWFEDRFFYVCYRVEGTPIKARDPAEIWGPTSPKSGSGVTTDKGNHYTPRKGSKKSRVPDKPRERREEPKRIDGEPVPDV